LAIVNKLKIKPLDQEREQIVKRHTKDPEAYSFYLKGRYFYNKRTEKDLERSIEDYRAAIARDPAFALPYAGLADTYSTMGFYHWLPMAEAKTMAKEASMKGLEIDDAIGETHAAYANIILWFDWQWARAEEEYKKALELSPSDVEARHMYAHLLESSGRMEEALVEMRRALELEPLSINLNTCLAQILFFARRTDEAIDRLGKTIEMDPAFPLQYFWLGRSYLQKGMLEEAVKTFEKGTQYPAIHAIALGGLGHAYALAGRRDDARRILDQMDRLSKERHIDSYYLAFVHAGMKDPEKTLDYLERACDEGDMYLFSLKVDPAFEDLQGHPRFRELMKRTGLAGFPAADAVTSQEPVIMTTIGFEPGIGRTVAHYHLLGKIGEGGMGVVYKAEDTKLRRTVALKFLPPEMTRDKTAAARFLREAQTAAALDHPNICTVFEINEEGGQTYISMAYIEGVSLKEKIALGPLGIEEALDIASQLAEGLRAAHTRGIIHRDIKPGNIMLTPAGQVKIMDFGLAKFNRGVDVTQTAAVIGTIAYMSPEQARGDPVDQRTDVWSFGTVLYEMLSGRLPFGKRPEQLLYFAILNEKPEALRSAQPNVPRAIERIVMKALEKDPVRRHQNMDEFIYDLTAFRPSAAVVTPPEPKRSIIVLPFENISPDPDQEYFCDGMTEELITDLSHIHDLLVISRSSAMTFKGTIKTIPEIARSANVRYVLEGSVRKAGTSLRITAQLIDAANDAHVWAEKYTGTTGDVFDIQEKVSRAIAEEIKLQLTPEEEARISERRIDNIEAYEYYLKARREIYKLTKDGLDNALRYLEKGLEIVGENVLLYACMGNVYYQYWNYGVRPDLSNLQKAKECAERVFALEPDSPHGHFLLGLLQTFINPPQAIKHFKRVLAVDPYHPETLLWLSIYLVFQGKKTDAEVFLERLFRVDPLNTIVKILPGNLHFHCGWFETALKELKNVYDSDPDHFVAQFHYARALAYINRRREASTIMKDLLEKMPGDMRTRVFELYMVAFQGEKSKLARLMSPEFLAWAQRDWMACLWLAEIFSLLQEKDKALDWLSRAVDLGSINYPFLNEFNPLLSNVRCEPRFQKLMERVKREWEDFEV
jgi:serine/threonine protein kinase/tetratricopeptide (TPR) repeat protein